MTHEAAVPGPERTALLLSHGESLQVFTECGHGWKWSTLLPGSVVVILVMIVSESLFCCCEETTTTMAALLKERISVGLANI